MSGGEIAGLIAAIAFAILVVFIVRVLLQKFQNFRKSRPDCRRSKYDN